METSSHEKLARQLHEWYLEATEKLKPESYNKEAQKGYDDLTEDQRFIDRYIAEQVMKEYVAQYKAGVERGLKD